MFLGGLPLERGCNSCAREEMMQCLEELLPHGLHNCCKSGVGVSGRVLIQAARLMEEGMFLGETLTSPHHFESAA